MKDLASYIDHTLLKADASAEAVRQLCREARKYGFASVCVNSCRVAICVKALGNSGVAVCSVVGFPLGAMDPGAKAFEAERALEAGALEIDMVMNIGAFKDGEYELVEEDIRRIRKVCGSRVLKVILETCLLTEEEIIRACEISQRAGADFVKTSSGFSTEGATLENVALMRHTVGPSMGVKASGGVRSREDALRMIVAGASRIGTSSGVAIMREDTEARGR
ncbi:MAG: deoxyribose-phosphate aldolase [Thermovirgaceae bacterium]|nr:deoxyribose-phosphate aldolase [Thermovirgaceae bacterium]